MMARGHALMGAAVWLGGCAIEAQFTSNHLPSWPLLIIGTPVCAGWAIVPDIDHPNSTVSRSLGSTSRLFAELVATGCRLVHIATKTEWDREDRDGHRTLTHTFLGAIAFGVAVAVLGFVGGRWIAPLLVFWPAHLGIQATLKSRRRKERWGRRIRIRRSITDAAALAVLAAVLTPGSAWWLGLAAGGGAAIHIAGDMLTDSVAPALWPMVLRDQRGRPQRWQPIGLPRSWRFSTGGQFEVLIVHRALAATSAAVLLLISWPVLAELADRIGQH